MHPTDRERARMRWGTRKIRDGDLISETRRGWHAVTTRAWYLLVPFIGFAWANGALVRPAVSAIEQEATAAKQVTLEQATEIRRQVNEARLQAAGQAAAAEAEYTPRLLRQRAVLDSLAHVRRALERDPSRLQAELDSLRHMQERHRAGNDQLVAAQRDRAARLADLQVRRTSLQDTLVVLERQLARVDAELQRRETRRELTELVSYVWYVVAPCLGAIWVQDS